MKDVRTFAENMIAVSTVITSGAIGGVPTRQDVITGLLN